MTTDDFQRALKLIGVDPKDGRSRVLRAIITSQDKMRSGCTFDELRTKILEETGGKEVARPLIYRYLKSLEEDNLISVDRDANLNRYMVDISTLSKSFDSIRNEKVASLEEKRNRLRTTKSSLSTLDASWLSRDLIEMLVGGPFESCSRSTHGKIPIRELIGAEIYSRSRKGDLVRMTLDWDFKMNPNEEKKRAIGHALFSRGVKMRFLLHNPARADAVLLKDRINEYKQIRSNPLLKEMAESRVTFKKTKTYQSVSLNRDGIVLIVSEDPYTGVWVPRTANSKLVDDVINSFDEDFENAVDLLELEENA